MNETIELKTLDNHNFNAFISRPDSKPKGGLVVIQEIFGVQMFRLQHPNKQRMLSSLDVMMGGQNGFFVNKKSSLTNRI